MNLMSKILKITRGGAQLNGFVNPQLRPPSGYRIYASGLRNPNGLAWEPEGGALWTVVNERDELGCDLVPDYLTSVPDGSFFGWPYSYFGPHLDDRVQPPAA
jgi:glucose/arabinose dehydrogenase